MTHFFFSFFFFCSVSFRTWENVKKIKNTNYTTEWPSAFKRPCFFFFPWLSSWCIFSSGVSCLFTRSRYLLLSPVTHCIPSITIGKLKAIGFGCIIWEASAPPASCFLYSGSEQEQLTALSVFPKRSSWCVFFLSLFVRLFVPLGSG